MGVLFRALQSVMALALPIAAFAAPVQSLQGHVPRAVSKLQPLGTLDSTNQLHLAIGLPLRNQPQLAKVLKDIYDPGRPGYRHYLTVEQFTQAFGPTESDYQALIAFAQANSLEITARYPNRMLLSLRANVAQVEKAFHVQLRQYQHPSEHRLFYAPDREPSLDLPIPVLHISGLDNLDPPRPGATAGSPPRHAIPKNGSGPAGSYLDDDLRTAYVPGVKLTGAGQQVGLLEFDGYFTNDIAAYAYLAGRPAVPLSNILIDGFSGVPDPSMNNSFEVSLDIEMAMAMAPGLSQILVYEAASTGAVDDLLNQMATDNLARQLSSSWWFTTDDSTRQIFQEFAAQGQSFFILSGDNGAYNPQAGAGILPPSDSPYLTVVGGTILFTDADGAWNSERAWSGSGGGISFNTPIPTWQEQVDMSSNGVRPSGVISRMYPAWPADCTWSITMAKPSLAGREPALRRHSGPGLPRW
jgi:subtilase family serine protease